MSDFSLDVKADGGMTPHPVLGGCGRRAVCSLHLGCTRIFPCLAPVAETSVGFHPLPWLCRSALSRYAQLH